MIKLLPAVLAGFVMSGGVPDTPSSLLAPADPARQTHWSAPPRPTTGLKPFTPVDPKDWREMNRNVAPAPSIKSKQGTHK